ncbi:MAG: isopentenyl phosphate kinase, partial [Candidatus Methanospirareceae archaeon]
MSERQERRERRPVGEVCVLKIGGSVLTEKGTAGKGTAGKGTEKRARKSEIKRIAEEIALALSCHEQRGKGLVLVHGAGSYGHPQAKRYLASRDPRDALVTHESAKELNRMVVGSLVQAGLKAVPIHPLSGVVSKRGAKGRELKYKIKEQIKMALKGRIIPVLHGDIIFDEEQGFRILSGDQLVVYAAKEVAKEFGARAVKVGVGSDVDGVLSGGREGEGEVVRELTPADAERERKRKSIKGSGHLDVTGGMREKVRLLAKLAD